MWGPWSRLVYLNAIWGELGVELNWAFFFGGWSVWNLRGRALPGELSWNTSHPTFPHCSSSVHIAEEQRSCWNPFSLCPFSPVWQLAASWSPVHSPTRPSLPDDILSHFPLFSNFVSVLWPDCAYWVFSIILVTKYFHSIFLLKAYPLPLILDFMPRP